MAERRRIKEGDLKQLFALSRNVCAFPSCEEVLAKPEWNSVQCEIAHIYGLNPGSARYVQGVSDNSLDNLILMCPNHHNLIDNLEPERYPADVIFDWKVAHESVEAIGWKPDSEMVEEIVEKVARKLDLTVIVDGGPEPIRSDPARIARAQERDRKAAQARQAERARAEAMQREHQHSYPPSQNRAPKRVRIHELAKELNMTPEGVLEVCGVLGVAVKGPSTPIAEPYADMVRRRIERDRASSS